MMTTMTLTHPMSVPSPILHRAQHLAPVERIIRTHEFAGRARPLNLNALLVPILRNCPAMRPEALVVALAEELVARTSSRIPARWLDKLAGALQVDRVRVRVPEGIFDELPRAAWSDPALLGEWLNATRQHSDLKLRAAQTDQFGRANRMSEGCVYTPPAVARTIIEDLHVGARRVVDPACGAGVFLIEAFRRAFARRIENGIEPELAAEDALTHEIAGVDIDEKALAVAEFSLRTLAFMSSGLDRDVHLDLRHTDALAPIAELDGQCDCIVGNPPYVEGRGLSKTQLLSLRDRFESAGTGKINLFAVFIERALAMLKPGGVMAFVVPSTFQRNARYKALREMLLKHTIESIKPLDAGLFGERVVETCVLRVRKTAPGMNSIVATGDGETPQSQLSHGPSKRFCNTLEPKLRTQISQMEKLGVPMSDLFEVRDGISTGFQPFPKRLLGTVINGIFTTQEGSEKPYDPRIHKRIIDGSEFNTFTPIHWAGRYIEYDKHLEHFPPHPGRPFNCQLRDAALYDRSEKLITRQTAKGIIATVDRERYFVRNSVHVTFAKSAAHEGLDVHGRDFDAARDAKLTQAVSLDALCVCLNTKLYSEYLIAVTGENGVVFPQVHIADLKTLPIIPALLAPGGELDNLGAVILDMHRQSITPSKDIRALMGEVQSLLMSAFELA
ncbi:MAG: N-6 DNA methylase [Planctomycetota bacterium]